MDDLLKKALDNPLVALIALVVIVLFVLPVLAVLINVFRYIIAYGIILIFVASVYWFFIRPLFDKPKTGTSSSA